MNAKRLLFPFLSLTLLPVISAAQKKTADSDSTQTDSVKTVYFFQDEFFLSDSIEIDSSFKKFKGSDNRFGYPTLNNGNPGQAFYSVLYHRNMLTPSLVKGFDGYFKSVGNIAFYNTAKPHSELTYINGSKRDQFFNLLHTQNFGKHFNIKLDLTKRSSEGFYNNLSTNHTFFDFSTNYLSKNKRYSATAFYYMNRIRAKENGGYANFDVIENPELSGTTLLDQAGNRIKDQRYFLRQNYRFGKTTVLYDKDSLESKDFTPYFELAYTFQYAKSEKLYDDPSPDTTFYNTFYIDSLSTFDSIFRKQYENEVIFSMFNGHYAFFGLSGGHQLFHQYQSIITDTTYNNYFAGGFIRKKFKTATWMLQGRYFVNGYNEGDIITKSSWNMHGSRDSTGKGLSYTITAAYSMKEPDYFLTRYESNHFEWLNHFNKVSQVDLSASLDVNKFHFSAIISMFDDLVMFDMNAQPYQYKDALQAVAVSAQRKFRLGNFFLDNVISYQKSSEEQVLPLPNIVLNETFYYQNFLFKDALLTRIGVNAFYYSEHQGWSYTPVLNQYHVSPAGTAKLGNYPFFNFFLDMKVKRMKLFFMLTHANYGYSGDESNRVPNYPLPPRAFRFGLNWVLFP